MPTLTQAQHDDLIEHSRREKVTIGLAAATPEEIAQYIRDVVGRLSKQCERQQTELDKWRRLLPRGD